MYKLWWAVECTNYDGRWNVQIMMGGGAYKLIILEDFRWTTVHNFSGFQIFYMLILQNQKSGYAVLLQQRDKADAYLEPSRTSAMELFAKL